MVKDLNAVDVQVVLSCLKLARETLVRRRNSAVGENVRVALEKDIQAVDAVINKL